MSGFVIINDGADRASGLAARSLGVSATDAARIMVGGAGTWASLRKEKETGRTVRAAFRSDVQAGSTPLLLHAAVAGIWRARRGEDAQEQVFEHETSPELGLVADVALTAQATS